MFQGQEIEAQRSRDGSATSLRTETECELRHTALGSEARILCVPFARARKALHSAGSSPGVIFVRGQGQGRG